MTEPTFNRISYNAQIMKAARQKWSGQEVDWRIMSDLKALSIMLLSWEDPYGYPVDIKHIPEFIRKDIDQKISESASEYTREQTVRTEYTAGS